MSFQTTDSKKEEFRKYLEKAGVVDQLTRVLVGLYEEPEKPVNAIEYVKKYLGSPVDIDVDKLKMEYEKLKDENIKLKRQVEELKKEVRDNNIQSQPRIKNSEHLQVTQQLYIQMQQLCKIHNEMFTNICLDPTCFTPLCPDCIELHRRETNHAPFESIKIARVQCNRKVRQCVVGLTRILELPQMQNQSDQYRDSQMVILEDCKQQVIKQVNSFFDKISQNFQEHLQQMHKGSTLPEVFSRITQLITQLEIMANGLDRVESLRSVYLLKSDDLISKAQSEAYSQISLLKLPYFSVSGSFKEDFENNLSECLTIKLNQEVQQVEQVIQQLPISVFPGYEIKESDYFDMQALQKILPFFKGNSKELFYLDMSRLCNSTPLKLTRKVLYQDFRIPLFHQSVVTKLGEIYLLGGVIPDYQYPQNKSQVIYQLQANSLEQVGGLKIARSSHGCVVVDKIIYCISGVGDNSKFIKSCERFDIILKKTFEIQDCKYASSSCLVVKFNDFLYKFGGVDAIKQPIRVIERYSLTNHAWSDINPQLSKADGAIIKESGLNCFASGLQISSNSLIVFGGYHNEEPVNTTFIFSDADNICRIIRVNEIPLTQKAAFWQQQSTIFGGQLYALQKEDQPDSQGVRMIRFNGTQWF